MQHLISEPETVLTGVPQCSIVGPIIYSMYVNDFPYILKYFEALIYADGMGVIFAGDALNELHSKINEQIERALAWLTNSQLVIIIETKHTVPEENIKRELYTLFF